MPNLEIRRSQRHVHEIEAILKLRKASIPFHLALHDAEIQIGAVIEKLGVKLRAADEEQLARWTQRGVRLRQTARVAYEPHIALREAVEAELKRPSQTRPPMSHARRTKAGAEL